MDMIQRRSCEQVEAILGAHVEVTIFGKMTDTQFRALVSALLVVSGLWLLAKGLESIVFTLGDTLDLAVRRSPEPCQNSDTVLTWQHYTNHVSALPSVRGDIVLYGQRDCRSDRA